MTNNVWSFRYDGATLTDFATRNTQFTPSLDGQTLNQIVSFGEDANGEMYVVDQGSGGTSGQIFKIVPPTGDTSCEPPCEPSDLDCNGVVNGADLALLLSNWGAAGTGDIDDNGIVNGADLAQLLSNWG